MRLETSEWWAAEGFYHGCEGTYLVPISMSVPSRHRQEVAVRRLDSTILMPFDGLVQLNTAQLAWKDLESCIENIIQHRKDCYTRVAFGVYFIED